MLKTGVVLVGVLRTCRRFLTSEGTVFSVQGRRSTPALVLADHDSDGYRNRYVVLIRFEACQQKPAHCSIRTVGQVLSKLYG